MQGKIYKIVKILGRMNSRTVMMERFQDTEFSWHCCTQKTVTIPRSVCVLYLLFTQPSLIRSFHSSDPCFSVSCPRGSDMRWSTVLLQHHYFDIGVNFLLFSVLAWFAANDDDFVAVGH